MPKNQERIKTRYPGVYYIENQNPSTGKMERVYYIRYRKGSRLVEEKAGRQFQDDMTPARAANLRTQRIEGNQPSNQERRDEEKTAREAELNRWTINRLWAEYRIQREANKGLKVDEYRFEKYIKPAFGDKEPSQVIQLDVDRVRMHLSRKLTPQTVKHVLALLKRIFNFGAKKGLAALPLFEIEMPKVNNQKTEDLNPEQLKRLLDAIDADPHVIIRNLMRLVLSTGMRKSECLRLCWNEIDFERGFITIKDPKGGTNQKIPLNDSARRILQENPRSESPLVFPNPQGGQYANIRWAVNRIRERAGLPKDFRPLHGSRHFFASSLASSGAVDMYVLQRLLTHKSPQMTQRYAHLRDESLKRASDLAGKTIEQAQETEKPEQQEAV